MRSTITRPWSTSSPWSSTRPTSKIRSLLHRKESERACEKVHAGRTFTSEQVHWLDRIKAHLIENLSIDEEDFEVLPIFARFGGWKKANAVFSGNLPDFLFILIRL